MDDCKKLIEINELCLSTHFPEITFRNDCVIPQPKLKYPLDGVSDCPLIDTRPGSPTFGQSNLCVCWFPIPAGNGNPAANTYLVQSSFNENFIGPSTNEQIVYAPDTEICYNIFETTGVIREGQTIYWRIIAAYIDEDTGTGCVSLKSETRSFTTTCNADDFNNQLCEKYNVQLNIQGPDFVKNCECCTFWVDGSSDCYDFAGTQILNILEPTGNEGKDDPLPVDWTISPEIFDISTAEFGENRKSLKVCPCVDETQSVNICSKIWFETNIRLEDFFLPDYENPEDAPESEHVVFYCEACKKITVDDATEIEERETISNLAVTDGLKTLSTCGIPLNSNSCSDLKVNVKGIVNKFEVGGCPPGFNYLPVNDCDCNCFAPEITLKFEFTPTGSQKCYIANAVGTLDFKGNVESSKLRYDLLEQDEQQFLPSDPRSDGCKSFCFNPQTGDCQELPDGQQCPTGTTQVSQCPQLFCRDANGECVELCAGGDEPCSSSNFPSNVCQGGFDATCQEGCGVGLGLPPLDCNILNCESLTEPVDFILINPASSGEDIGGTGVLFPGSNLDSTVLNGFYTCDQNLIRLNVDAGNIEYENIISLEDLICGRRIKLYKDYENCPAEDAPVDCIEIQIVPRVLSQLNSDIKYLFDDVVFDDPDKTTLAAPCMTLVECVKGNTDDDDENNDQDSLKWNLSYCLTSNGCVSGALIECGQCNSCGNVSLGVDYFDYALTINGTIVSGSAFDLGDGVVSSGDNHFDFSCSPDGASYSLYLDNGIIIFRYESLDINDEPQETLAPIVLDINCGQTYTDSLTLSIIQCPGEAPIEVVVDIEVIVPECESEDVEAEVSAECNGALFTFETENSEGKVTVTSAESCFACEKENQFLLTTDQDIPFDRCYFDVNKHGQITLKKTAFFGVIVEKVDEEDENSNCYQVYSGQECTCDNVFPVKIKIKDLEFFVTQAGGFTTLGKSTCTDCKVSEYRLTVECNDDGFFIKLSEFCDQTGEIVCFTSTDGDQLIKVENLPEDSPCNDLKICTAFSEVELMGCSTSFMATAEFSNHGYVVEDPFGLVTETPPCGQGNVFVELDQNTKNYVITRYDADSVEDFSEVGPFCATVTSFGEQDICDSGGSGEEEGLEFSRENIRVRCERESESCTCQGVQSLPLTICLGDSSGGFRSEVFTGNGIRQFVGESPIFINCTGFSIVSVGFSCFCDNMVVTLYEGCFATQGDLDLAISQGFVGQAVGFAEIDISQCNQQEIDFEITSGEDDSPVKTGKILLTLEVENCLGLCVEKESKVWVDFDSCNQEFNLVSQDVTCINGLKRGHTYIAQSHEEGKLRYQAFEGTIEVDCADAEGSDEDGNPVDYLLFIDDCCQSTCCKKKDSCECGQPGEKYTGTVVVSAEPEGMGQILIPNFEGPKPFKNECDQDVVVEQNIEVFINPECEFIFCDCGEDEEYWFCVCGEIFCTTLENLRTSVFQVNPKYCYCEHGEYKGHDITFFVLGEQLFGQVGGDSVGLFSANINFCDNTTATASSGFCYPDLDIKFGPGKFCVQDCLEEPMSCDCWMYGCWLGCEFRFNLFEDNSLEFKNAVCCDGRDGPQDSTLTLSYQPPEEDCSEGTLSVNATICDNSETAQIQVPFEDLDSFCGNETLGSFGAVGDFQFQFGKDRSACISCEPEDISECCEDSDVGYCCCEAGDEKGCVKSTTQMCAKVGGEFRPTLGECEDICKDPKYKCNQSSGNCEEDEDGDFDDLDDCNAKCGKWCCIDGVCSPVSQDGCNTQGFDSEQECVDNCGRYCCNRSTGDCELDPAGVPLPECEQLCKDLTGCCCKKDEGFLDDPTSLTSHIGLHTVSWNCSVYFPESICDADDKASITYNLVIDPPLPNLVSQSITVSAQNGASIINDPGFGNAPNSGSFEASLNCSQLNLPRTIGVFGDVVWNDPNGNPNEFSLGNCGGFAFYEAPCDTSDVDCDVEPILSRQDATRGPMESSGFINKKLSISQQSGVGTNLEQKLQEFELLSKDLEIFDKIDNAGKDWVEENINQIVKEIVDNLEDKERFGKKDVDMTEIIKELLEISIEESII